MATSSSTETELRELLTLSCKILYHLGLSDYLGHPSARIPGTERVLIKPKHSPTCRGMDTMTPDRMVVVDLDGKLLEGEEIPPSEVFIHTEIYRARPDVLSVVHTHQPMATLCGIVSLPILPVLHIAGPLVERPVPVWPCAKLVTDRELGAQQARALGDGPVCHLQGHGIVSVDKTVQEATIGAIHLERLAEANFSAAQVGLPPRVIPPDELAQLKEMRASPAGRWAYYVDLVTNST